MVCQGMFQPAEEHEAGFCARIRMHMRLCMHIIMFIMEAATAKRMIPTPLRLVPEFSFILYE